MQNLISCSEEVPWKNTNYFLEEVDKNTGTLSELDQSEFCDFKHSNLENSTEYCYRIKTDGTYGLNLEPRSLINYSQIVCGIPLDTIGPCPPIVQVQNPCASLNEENIEYINSVIWEPNRTTCTNQEEIISYNVYYATDSITSDLQLIAQITSGDLLRVEHLPDLGIAGCYYVSAIDELGNEGLNSIKVCVDNCPIYELPNAFTPNNDGTNDLFRPRENQFVAQIDFKLGEFAIRIYGPGAKLGWENNFGKRHTGRNLLLYLQSIGVRS